MIHRLSVTFVLVAGLVFARPAPSQSARPKIPVYVECKCPDTLGSTFGTKIKSLVTASTPYQLSDKATAVFQYIIVSVDGDKTKLAPAGQLSAISTLITGDDGKWVHHAVYAVTNDTVDEAAQNDLRSLSDLIMEAMRQRNN
ncbi:hypothetical protein [Granulicella arctica]|uniref:Uncharacterized protein n=1 Tax=Granulicella arctica TaxID=940613 RepID=A0A7Y9TTR0_9BACT|nr:hypothetical protein [Granulicella arctica]NYF80218.1 hypothetical protein [Granulicella arctica]